MIDETPAFVARPILNCPASVGEVVTKLQPLYPVGAMAAVGGSLGEVCAGYFANADLSTSVSGHMAQHRG